MATLSPAPKMQFFDAAGEPLVGGKLYSYGAGTTTPLATYTSSAGTTTNTNPVILNSRGEAEVWLGAPLYKFKLTTATDVEIWTVDNVGGYATQTDIINLEAALAASSGSSLIGFLQSGASAITRTVQSKLRDVVSVKDFGAVGDGVTDDTAAIQAALNSGATKVTVPKGVYKTGSLTLPSWIHLVGETFEIGVGSGEGGATLLFDLGSGTALTCGDNPVIQYITFKNTAGTYEEATLTLLGTTASCIQLTGNITMDYCNFYYWYICIKVGFSCYYMRTSNIEFARCTTGYFAPDDVPYDTNIIAPISRLTDTFIAGVSAYGWRNIKIYGGSIEGYRVVAQYFNDISIFGTYFETSAPRSGCFAIDPLKPVSTVALYGCLIYTNYTARFVNMSGQPGTILSSGNIFDGIGPASGTCFYLPDSGNVSLSGDRFGNEHATTFTYVNSTAVAGGYNIIFPNLPTTNSQYAYASQALVGLKGIAMSARTSAPSASTLVLGAMMLADGNSWDPLARGYGRPYWVVWQGDRWYPVSG